MVAGLNPLALLWVAALWSTTQPLERELAARAGQALRACARPARLGVSGRDLTFAAAAFSREGRQSAVAAIEAVPGIRWWSTKAAGAGGAAVRLDDRTRRGAGALGAPAAAGVRAALRRRRVRRSARLRLSTTGLARGAPPRFDAAATLLIEQVPSSRSAHLAVRYGREAGRRRRELGGREAIAAALKSLPPGYRCGQRDPGAALRLSGQQGYGCRYLDADRQVPRHSAKAHVIGAAERNFVSGKVADQLKTSIGAPAGFVAAAVPALEALSRLSTGSWSSPPRGDAEGDALYAVAVTDIRSRLLSNLPRDWARQVEYGAPGGRAVDATVCQDLLGQLMGRAAIRFESGGRHHRPRFAGLLDRVVETAMRCPSAPIDVIGHTDAEGDEPATTIVRAPGGAVVDYLVRAGLPAERFTALGAGSLRPVGRTPPPKAGRKTAASDSW